MKWRMGIVAAGAFVALFVCATAVAQTTQPTSQPTTAPAAKPFTSPAQILSALPPEVRPKARDGWNWSSSKTVTEWLADNVYGSQYEGVITVESVSIGNRHEDTPKPSPWAASVDVRPVMAKAAGLSMEFKITCDRDRHPGTDLRIDISEEQKKEIVKHSKGSTLRIRGTIKRISISPTTKSTETPHANIELVDCEWVKP